MRVAGSSSPSMATSVTVSPSTASPTATLRAAPPTNSRDPLGSRSSSMSASPTTVIRFVGAGGCVIRSVFLSWGDLAGAALDEPGRHDRARRGGVVALEPREDALGRDPADPLRILCDHGEAGFEEVAERHVVEADECDVAVTA